METEGRYRPAGVLYRSISPRQGEISARRLPGGGGAKYYPDFGGHAEGPTDDPPPSYVNNPGMWNRKVVQGPPQGQGRDAAGVDNRTWPVPDPKQWGAKAIYKFGHFVYNRFTNRQQVQAKLIPNVAPAGGDPRPGFVGNPSALQLPQYRFTAVTDSQVMAQAVARANARAKAGR